MSQCAFNCPCNAKLDKIQKQLEETQADELSINKAKIADKLSKFKSQVAFFVLAAKITPVPTAVASSLAVTFIIMMHILPFNILFNIGAFGLYFTLVFMVFKLFLTQFINAFVNKLGEETASKNFDIVVNLLAIFSLKCCKTSNGKCPMRNLCQDFNIVLAVKIAAVCVGVMIFSKIIPLSCLISTAIILVHLFFFIQFLNRQPFVITKVKEFKGKAKEAAPAAQVVDNVVKAVEVVAHKANDMVATDNQPATNAADLEEAIKAEFD